MRYAFIVEKARRNFAAYVPDLPGCVATAPTRKAVEKRIREAIDLHIAGMREDGMRIPRPNASAGWIEVSASPVARRKAG